MAWYPWWLPAEQETRVQSLSQEDPLEKEMATLLKYSCLKSSMDREAWGATQFKEPQRVEHVWATNTHTWMNRRDFPAFSWTRSSSSPMRDALPNSKGRSRLFSKDKGTQSRIYENGLGSLCLQHSAPNTSFLDSPSSLKPNVKTLRCHHSSGSSFPHEGFQATWNLLFNGSKCLSLVSLSTGASENLEG